MRSSEVDPTLSPYERAMARQRRTKRRDWILALIGLVAVALIAWARLHSHDSSALGPAHVAGAAES